MKHNTSNTLYRGRFLELMSTGGLEYVRRSNALGVVAAVPLRDDGRVVLVEQHRPAAGASVIEWPAGLVGDEPGSESHLHAVERELLEETGYTTARWRRLGEGMSSAGLTDEAVVFYLALGLRRVAPGGGVAGEGILVHEVAHRDLPRWLQAMQGMGKRIDVKVYAGLGMLTEPLGRGFESVVIRA